MAGGRYDPSHELLRIQDMLHRIFAHGGFEKDEDELISGSWTPPCDIFETKDAVILRAELAGVHEEDVDIQVENSVLTIRGKRAFVREAPEQNYHRIERSYGGFVRSFTLPTTVDADRITARFDRGVLELKMPKRDETRPRSIKVEVGK